MNTNYLQPKDFQVTVDRLPEVAFHAQKVNIPSVSISPIEAAFQNNKVYFGSDSMDFGTFDLSFLVDEDMQSYMSVFDWMYGIAFPDKNKAYADLVESEDGLVSDISVLISSNKKNANVKVIYQDCFPISLSDISMDLTMTNATPAECTVTFQYDIFRIELVE